MKESLKALYEYAEGITDINYRLRSGTFTDETMSISRRISKLESFMRLPILYRGTLWDDFSGDYGITRENIHSMVGRIIVDRGYLSTSTNREVPFRMYPIDKGTLFMRILSKGKYRAIDVNRLLGSHSPSPSQKEILLGRNTKFRLLRITEIKGITHIDVELKS